MKISKILAAGLGSVLLCSALALAGCGGGDQVTFVVGDTHTVVAAENGRVALPEDPAQENYAFKGWFTEENGAGERITADTAVQGSITAYAYFEPYVDMTGRNVIEIGGYNGVTEEYIDKTTQEVVYAEESDFALLAELGVDVIYLTYMPSETSTSVYSNYLDWMDKYGIQAYIRDVELNDKLQQLSASLDFNDASAVSVAAEQLKPLVERYSERPLFKGNFLVDEPRAEELDMYGSCYRLYREAFPDQYMYVNLFPNYAFLDGSGIVDTQAFESYISKASELFDFLSQDHYPIHTRTEADGEVRYLEAGNYYAGMYYPAAVARDADKDYGNYIWAMKNVVSDENRHYAPSVSDLRFEAFNSMAFGASKISLFCASTPPSSLGAGQGIIDQGKKTEGLFENASQVIKEVKALSDVFDDYLWQDAACFYAGGSYGTSMVLALQASYESYLQEVQSDTDLLIGLFDEANGDGCAFMLVNNGDITSEDSSSVSFAVSGALSVTAHIGTGSSALEKNAEGKYTLTLEQGQGAFISVEM